MANLTILENGTDIVANLLLGERERFEMFRTINGIGWWIVLNGEQADGVITVLWLVEYCLLTPNSGEMEKREFTWSLHINLFRLHTTPLKWIELCLLLGWEARLRGAMITVSRAGRTETQLVKAMSTFLFPFLQGPSSIFTLNLLTSQNKHGLL